MFDEWVVVAGDVIPRMRVYRLQRREDSDVDRLAQRGSVNDPGGQSQPRYRVSPVSPRIPLITALASAYPRKKRSTF